MAKKNIIIVGAGIVGLFAYTYLKKKFNVKLIETSKKIGGLYSSEKINNYYYDYGIHIPFETGNKYIDKYLFKKNFIKNCNVIDRSIREGVYFKKKLDLESGTLDFRLFDNKNQKKAKLQILKKKKIRKFNNLFDKINSVYGETLRKKLFEPVIFKLTKKTDLSKIYPNFLEDFSINRIRIFNDEYVKKLKKNKYFDSIISYNKTKFRKSNIKKFYPLKGGSINWVKSFFDIKKNSKNLYLNTSINKISTKNKKIEKIFLSNKSVLKSDHIIWTAPPIHLLNMAEKKSPSSKPYFINLILTHLEIDKKFDHNLEYLSCYDENFKTFRVTFYSNLRGSFKKKPFNLTVETLSNDHRNLNLNFSNIILKELKTIGVINKRSSIINSKVQIKRNIFPIQSPKNSEVFKKQIMLTKKNFRNVILAGRNSGTHGLILNLNHIYKVIKNL